MACAGGYVDIFTESGTFVKTLIHGKPLNQPWGFAMAPSNFGPLSNTLLISNNTNTGTINGFDPTTGAFVGTIKNAAGTALHFNQIWGIEFGGGIGGERQHQSALLHRGTEEQSQRRFWRHQRRSNANAETRRRTALSSVRRYLFGRNIVSS